MGVSHHDFLRLTRPIAALVRPVPCVQTQFILIDVLRGMATLTIIIFHYKNFFLGSHGQGLEMSVLDEIGFFQVFDVLRTHGALAVMLFWMISGFVLMLVYGDRVARLNGRSYVANRISRLYPLHLVTLLYVAGLQSLSQAQFGTWQI